MSVLSVLGAVLLVLLKGIGVLLLVVLILAVVLLFCPFCADVQWANDVLTIRAGALGLTLPVFQYPAPEKPKKKKKKKPAGQKADQKPRPETPPRKKARLTLNILCTILRGAGRLTRAIIGSLRITKIDVVLGVRGEDPAETARSYGRLNAWLYPALGSTGSSISILSSCGCFRILVRPSRRCRTGCPSGCRHRRMPSSLRQCVCFTSSGAKKCWTSSYNLVII